METTYFVAYINGDNRFSLLQKGITNITEKMLTTQLREMEETGLISRKVVCEKPLNVQYSLSNKYPKIQTIINTLCDFSKAYGKMNNIIVHD